MTREKAKQVALAVTTRWNKQDFLSETHKNDWYYRQYGIYVDPTPWYRRFPAKLMFLHYGCLTFVAVFLSVFLQVVDKEPGSVRIDTFNWFYVASATAAAVVFASRTLNSTTRKT